MPFSNPIVGGNVLVRTAIQSRNYVAGVSGWAIMRDGTAEFNSATIRGSLVVGVSPSLYVISPTVPAELIAFYATFYGGSQANFYVRMQPDSSNYFYQVIFEASGTFVAFAMGWVISGVVKESFSSFYVPAAGQPTQLNFMLRNSGGYTAFGQLNAANLSTVYFQACAVEWNHGTHPEATWKIDGRDQPRGLTYFEQITTSVATPAALGEVLMFTTSATMTFVNGRAYRVTFSAQIKSAALQNPGVNIRLSNLAGTQLIGGPREPITTAGNDLPMIRDGFIVNTSGANVTKALALTCNPQAATAVTIEGGAGAGAGYWYVEDVGAAADFPGTISVS